MKLNEESIREIVENQIVKSKVHEINKKLQKKLNEKSNRKKKNQEADVEPIETSDVSSETSTFESPTALALAASDK